MLSYKSIWHAMWDAAPKINEDQLARDAVDQLRRMIAECYGAPHFALSRDEVDRVSWALQTCFGSAQLQETIAVKRAKEATINEGGQAPCESPDRCTGAQVNADEAAHARTDGAESVAQSVPPSPDAVRRFNCFGQEDGVYESATGSHVNFADYERLTQRAEKAECERDEARKELDAGLAEVSLAQEALRVCAKHAGELEAAQAECERLRADAERYRWLREGSVLAMPFTRYYWSDELDATIDAARKA